MRASATIQPVGLRAAGVILCFLGIAQVSGEGDSLADATKTDLHGTTPSAYNSATLSVDNSGVFFNVSSKMFSAQNLVLMVGSWNRAQGVFRVMTGPTGRIWMCKHCCWPSQVGPGVLTGRVGPDPKVFENLARVGSGRVWSPCHARPAKSDPAG